MSNTDSTTDSLVSKQLNAETGDFKRSIKKIAREADNAIFEVLSPDMGSGEVAYLIEGAIYRVLDAWNKRAPEDLG